MNAGKRSRTEKGGDVAYARRPVSYLAERVVGHLLFERHRTDPALVRGLREDAAALEARAARDTTTAVPIWERLRTEVRTLMRTGDAERFLRWPPVRVSMVRRGRRSAAFELAQLRARPDWRTRWRAAMRESTLGHPRPFHLMPSTSGTVIRAAYHLARFEEATGCRIPDARIVVEFGGGYGTLCRLVHRLGFHGTYVVFDLPEGAALQRFYLGHQGLAIAAADAVLPERGVLTTTDPERLGALLRGRPPGAAAFIAPWSLGESPVELRARVLPAVEDFDAFLIGYKAEFFDIDNRAWFSAWRARLLGHEWHDVPLTHLAKPERYLFGARRKI